MYCSRSPFQFEFAAVTQPTILLTGASGFVGRHAAIALAAAGFRVRAVTRSAERASRDAPELDWIECDIESNTALRAVLEGATAAVYLYHAIGSSSDYAEREARVARNFRHAADEAGLTRIVYLGGVVPRAGASRHLESRRLTGDILRQARATTIELRASMVIGFPSASFAMLRDLAVRLPILALPPWLDYKSCPIAICDVAAAIALACLMPVASSAWYELPGPECLSHRDLLSYLTGPAGTRVIEHRFAAMTPTLAALGIAAVSRVPAALSRELVMGLTSDLCPTGPRFWDLVAQPTLRPLRHAIIDALFDESAPHSPAPETRRRIARKTVDWIEHAGI
jgi:uncharacterized protein YbjT (DUF2867 family)